MSKENFDERKQVFRNLSETPQLAPGLNMFKVLLDFMGRPKNVFPPAPVPTVKTDLKSYYSEKPSVFWFGHSSYLIHCAGINVLVDPVFSGHASPVSFTTRAFRGADAYTPRDMPEIDVLIITHNHYDHLDKTTIRELRPKVKRYYTPLKVGNDLLHCSVDPELIMEMDWWQHVKIEEQLELVATPARHFSGRGLKRNGSLWASFVLDIHGHRIFLGSDSGYDEHFKVIGHRYGPFDLALLECGQYNSAWPYIHCFPEDLIKEGIELNARTIMPVHWGKFALALHPWDEPVKRFVLAAEATQTSYTTPRIGQAVVLNEPLPTQAWWEEIQK